MKVEIGQSPLSSSTGEEVNTYVNHSSFIVRLGFCLTLTGILINYPVLEYIFFFSFFSFFILLTSLFASSIMDSLLSVIDPIILPDRCPGEMGLTGSFIKDILLPIRVTTVFLLYCSAVCSASTSFALWNQR